MRGGRKACIVYSCALTILVILLHLLTACCGERGRHNAFPQHCLPASAESPLIKAAPAWGIKQAFQRPRARRQKLAWRVGFSSCARLRPLKLGTHLRKPFLVQTRFLTRGLFAARTSENPGRTSTRTRRMFCGRPLCLRSIHKTSASERKRIHIGKGFQPPRERRKKRVDVENFRPILAKFALPRASQKSRTAHSCAYKKLNYRN